MSYTLFETLLALFIAESLGIKCYSEITIRTRDDYTYETELIDDFIGYSFLEFYYMEDLFR